MKQVNRANDPPTREEFTRAADFLAKMSRGETFRMLEKMSGAGLLIRIAQWVGNGMPGYVGDDK